MCDSKQKDQRSSNIKSQKQAVRKGNEDSQGQRVDLKHTYR